MKRIPSVVIPMQKRSPIEKKLNYPRMSLLGGDMQRSQPFAVALVDNKRALLRIQKLFGGIEPSVTGKGRKARPDVIRITEISIPPGSA